MRDNVSLRAIPLQDLPVESNDDILIEDQDMQPEDIQEDDRLLTINELREVNLDNPWSFSLFRKIWYGPDNPQDDPPQPFSWGILEQVESVPEKFNYRVKDSVKLMILSIYLCLWFLIVYNILSPYFTIAPRIDGKHRQVLSLGCTDQLWKGKNGKCGLNGKKCFHEEMSDVFIRCPALCDRSWTYSLEPMGVERVKYRGYFIGGGRIHNNDDTLSHPYRADSYVCGSAVHAGLVSPFFGGCARISYTGIQGGFESAKGFYGVDDSLRFPSFFPSSYIFKSLGYRIYGCVDPRLPLLLVNIILGMPLVYMANGAIIFWVITTVGFWTIALATDPPVKVDANDLESYASLLSIGLERFFPSCFILYALWRCSTSITLGSVATLKTSYLSRLIYFYPFFWLGVLNNISFDRLPVDRFTLSDLKTQPGGALAVAGIVTLVIVCAIIQAYKIWKAGKFQRYLLIYICFITGLLLISFIPGLTLRIHHYILAMLLIPGCCTRGTTALLFQGILLGLFLSGAARWGLAAIAETATSLRRNDPSGEVIPPEITGYDIKSGVLTWIDPSVSNIYTGVSLLINDIERYVAENVTSVNFKQLIANSTELTKAINQTLNSPFVSNDNNIPLYIRIGKKVMGTNKYSDFSNAAILKWPSGEAHLANPGIT